MESKTSGKPLNDGFLSGFVEESIDKPKRGSKGNCVVHYSGQHSDCIMKVKLVRGKRVGEALIVKDDVPYIKLNYRNGKMTGNVERMTGDGKVDLKGQLINGVESGLFEEYKGDEVVWRGYYRNGERFSEVVKSRKGGRWYEERNVKNRELMSIAEYDDDLHDKNGRCMEYENGEWTGEWIYENGERVQPVREYRDGMITLYDNNGEKKKVIKMNEWDGMKIKETLDMMMKEEDNDSLMEYDLETGYIYGVWNTGKKCFVWKKGGKESRVVVGDLKTHEMRVYNGDEWEESIQDGVGCVDLDVSGKRWEGGVKYGKPFGYGILYSDEGKKEYEGFMVDINRICYGVEYYSDIEKVEYDGCYNDSQRFGNGILYDRNGEIAYDGLWMNNEQYSDQLNSNRIDNYTESIHIPNNSFNDVDSFILPSFLHSLQSIVIGDECFGKVRVFELDGLSELESVEIGERSFKAGENKRSDGSYRIVNCPKLEYIEMGEESFYDYHSFELDNLPSLKSICIGHCCFLYAPSFSLTDLPKLQYVDLGNYAFEYVRSVVFKNLPKLSSIELGDSAFEKCKSAVFKNLPNLSSIELGGDAFNGDDRKTNSKESYKYNNTLIMKNLPSLTRFIGQGCNFEYFDSVILENIPRLSFSGGELGDDSFRHIISLESSSTYSFISSSFDADELASFIEDEDEYFRARGTRALRRGRFC